MYLNSRNMEWENTLWYFFTSYYFAPFIKAGSPLHLSALMKLLFSRLPYWLDFPLSHPELIPILTLPIPFWKTCLLWISKLFCFSFLWLSFLSLSLMSCLLTLKVLSFTFSSTYLFCMDIFTPDYGFCYPIYSDVSQTCNSYLSPKL